MSVELYKMTMSGEQLDQLQDFLASVVANPADPNLPKRAQAWLDHTIAETRLATVDGKPA